jgi:hypothetical protein
LPSHFSLKSQRRLTAKQNQFKNASETNDSCFVHSNVPLEGANLFFKNALKARLQGLTPVILATQEAEIRRITVPSQPVKIVYKTLPQKTLSQKIGLVEVAQGEGP